MNRAEEVFNFKDGRGISSLGVNIENYSRVKIKNYPICQSKYYPHRVIFVAGKYYPENRVNITFRFLYVNNLSEQDLGYLNKNSLTFNFCIENKMVLKIYKISNYELFNFGIECLLIHFRHFEFEIVEFRRNGLIEKV